MDHHAAPLLAALALRLDAAVPRPLRVVAEGNALWLEEANGENWGQLSLHEADDEDLEDDERALDERMADDALGVLNQVQDWVSRSLREPWPRLPTGRMADYGARSDGRWIHCWYGSDEQGAVLAFAPIAVDALAADG